MIKTVALQSGTRPDQQTAAAVLMPASRVWRAPFRFWACNPAGTPDPSGVGLDCSGFARWVYNLAYGRDVLGSGNTDNQVAEMTKVSSPVAGDLVFFGVSATDTDHVGVYIGNGKMINGAETGTQVDTVPVADGPDSLIGYYQYG